MYKYKYRYLNTNTYTHTPTHTPHSAQRLRSQHLWMVYLIVYNRMPMIESPSFWVLPAQTHIHWSKILISQPTPECTLEKPYTTCFWEFTEFVPRPESCPLKWTSTQENSRKSARSYITYRKNLSNQPLKIFRLLNAYIHHRKFSKRQRTTKYCYILAACSYMCTFMCACVYTS